MNNSVVYNIITKYMQLSLQSLLEHFYHLRKNPIVSSNYHYPQPLATTNLLPVTIEFPILDFYTNRIVQHMIFL